MHQDSMRSLLSECIARLTSRGEMNIEGCFVACQGRGRGRLFLTNEDKKESNSSRDQLSHSFRWILHESSKNCGSEVLNRLEIIEDKL